jgi:hypothetical protein
MIDRTTKIILMIIALGLLANALTPLLRPIPVAAQNSPFACTGTFKVNPWGTTATSIGGYDIDLKCH